MKDNEIFFHSIKSYDDYYYYLLSFQVFLYKDGVEIEEEVGAYCFSKIFCNKNILAIF